MEATISLKEIIDILKKQFWLITIIVLLAVTASALYTYFLITPTYQASTQILVNQSQEEGSNYSSGDLRANLDLINTYNVIISSPRILEPTLKALELNRSTGALNEQISVSSVGESQVVNISVIDANPALAVDIANTLALVFQEDIVDIMSVDNVSILSSAEISDNPSQVSPNPSLNIVIAFVLGLMSAVGLIFLLEFLDNTIRTEDDVELKLDVPLLGSISKIDTSKMKMDEITQTRRARRGSETYGT